MIAKNEDVVWVESQIVVTRDPEGQPVGTRGVSMDITERHWYEQELDRYRRNLEEANARLEELAATDPLTGLANYRLLLDRIDLEIKRYGRTGRPFSILLLDLDGLKKINDAYGHVAGSRALCRIADVLRSHCREVDTPARYGGDEFALILPETPLEQAHQVADRISQRLANDPETPRISASIGVAEYPDDGQTIEHILGAADEALYSEKHKGQSSHLARR